MAYGKTFESLYTGSMVGAGLNVFGVWNYCIASAKPPGFVELNPIIMATIFGCPVQDVEDAIVKLCEPDPRSRSKECDGRRLVKEGEFLYSIPTWAKYNGIKNEIERREQNREAQKTWRNRQRGVSNSKQASAGVSNISRVSGVPSTSTSTSTSPYSGEGMQGEIPPSKPPELPPDFLEFWDAYGKKGSRRESLASWTKLKPNPELAAEVIAAAKKYRAAHADDPQFQKDGQRWLKNEGWNDEIVPRKDDTKRTGIWAQDYSLENYATKGQIDEYGFPVSNL